MFNLESRNSNMLLVLVLLILLIPSVVFGEVILTNPGIPEKETFIYSQVIDGKHEIVEMIVENRHSDYNSWLEYRYYSDVKEVLVKFNLTNFTAFYSEVWETQDDSSIHKINEILVNKKAVSGNELLITDMEGFLVSLRGFPWGKNANAKIVFINRTGSFSPELKVKGKENIQINDNLYECWKVQIGIGGLMGAVFPKSYYWYSVEAPHYLVRSEAAGMPGSPKTVLELQSYKVN